MSYDLGYESGYESDWEKVPVKNGLEAQSSGGVSYSMSAPRVPPGGASSDFVRRMMENYLGGLGGVPGGPGGAGGTGGTGGTGATGTANPNPPPGTGDPAAAGGLTGMGGTPASPGSLPSVAPEGTPTLSHTELVSAHSGAEWDGVRTELRDHYGFTPSEIDAFENQYNGRSPADLRSGDPPVLPAHPDNTATLNGPPPLAGAARTERLNAAAGVRRRVADDMVHDLGGRIHGSFAEGEISRDTADAMAAQMYRRAGADPDANPPDIGAMATARARPSGGGPSPIDRELSSLRGPSYRAPVHGDPSAGLHRADASVSPLMSETESVYRARAAESLGPAFAAVPGRGAYYGNTAAGRTHRSEDAQAFFTHRGIDHDAGALRGISRTSAPTPPPGATGAAAHPPHPMQAEVNTFTSAYRTTGTNALTPMGNGIATRMAADPSRPLDTTGWTPAARQQHDSAMALRRYDTATRETEATTAHNRTVELEGIRDGYARAREVRDHTWEATRMEGQHQLSMVQQRDQQTNQFMQQGFNQGMQLMQASFNNTIQMTSRTVEAIAAATSQMNNTGLEMARAFVQSMLGTGGRGGR